MFQKLQSHENAIPILILDVALALLCCARSSRAELSFQFTYADDANGTFASRGWLDADSLFQQNIRASIISALVTGPRPTGWKKR